MPRELNPKHVSIGVLLGEINVTVEAEKCPKRNLFRLCVSASHICQHFAGYGSNGSIHCHFKHLADGKLSDFMVERKVDGTHA